MATRNSITGDKIQTGVNSQAYRDSKFWDKRAEDEQKDILYPESNVDEQLKEYLKHSIPK